MPELRVGYFADFYNPTVLLWGDEAGLNALASFLVGLDEGEGFVLTDQPWVRVRGELHVTVDLSSEALGLALAHKLPPAFRWTLSRDLARDFVAMIRVVARSKRPCHHYLETGLVEAVVVTVSKGEYDDL